MNQVTSCDTLVKDQFFSFLLLPLELRLKIYALVLPSRTHTIVTQFPHSGYYYSEISLVSHSKQTLYPALPYSRPQAPDLQKLTTYKLLNANFHLDFPSPSVCPEILRTSKQIRNEAEPVMYGAETVFDFGVYVDAVVPFLEDRSALARRAIRHIRLAREIPVVLNLADSTDGRTRDFNHEGGEIVDCLWSRTSGFLRDQCAGLRTVNLTLWSENGGLFEETLAIMAASKPNVQGAEGDLTCHIVGDENYNEKVLDGAEDGALWRQWEWTRDLLKFEALRHVKVRWWGFVASRTREAKFDAWLGRRMVADELVRNRMVHEGHVIESVFVVPGDWYTN